MRKATRYCDTVRREEGTCTDIYAVASHAVMTHQLDVQMNPPPTSITSTVQYLVVSTVTSTSHLAQPSPSPRSRSNTLSDYSKLFMSTPRLT